MSFETISLEVSEDGIAQLILSRPEKHNALSALMIDELSQAAALISQNEAVRFTVLSALGKSFCAGGDLEWMREQFSANRETRMKEAHKLATMLNALNTLPQPLIAKVQGQAFGGGIGMISVCDAAFAVETAKFGLTETRLGLIPATISPYVLARIGEAHARNTFTSARIFDAEEARHMGLLTQISSEAQFEDGFSKFIAPHKLASPSAMRASKALIKGQTSPITPEQISFTISELANVWETEDAHEGVSAFFEKRKSKWVIPT